MKRCPRWLLGCALLLLLAVIFHASSASAATNNGLSFTTSPVSLDLAIQPGKTTTKTLEIMNNGSQPFPISMSLDSFGAYGTSGEAAISPLSSSAPTANYVHFSPANFTAQPGVWTPVQMTISLPKTASLGYYFAVIFRPNVPNPVNQKSTVVKGSNSVLVLVDTHSSNESRQLEIGNFTVSKGLYEYLPANFTINIHNSGNIFVAPVGNIYISRSSELTHSLAALSVNSGGGNVLPNSNRVFSASWNSGFPYFQTVMSHGAVVDNKQGQPIEKLKWDWGNVSKLRFGKYYAGLTLVYNNGSQIVTLHSLVSFWVIPWKLLLILLVIIAIFGFAIYSIGKAIYRRVRKIVSRLKNR